MGHESGSWDVAFTAGGDRLVSGGQAGGLRVWDVTDDGAPALHALATGSGYPGAVQFSPDGSEMVVFTSRGRHGAVATATGEVLGRLTDQKIGLPSYFPEASQDWSRVATVSAADGRTVVRDLRTLAPVAELPPCASPIALSPDGSLMMVDGRGPCTTANGPPELRAHSCRPCSAVAWSTSRPARCCSTWASAYTTAAVFNPGGRFPAGRYLAVNVGFESVEIYDMDTLTLLTSFDFGDDPIFGVSFDPEGRLLAGTTANGHAWVLDLAAVVAGAAAADAMVFDQTVHEGVTAGHALSADGLLATAGLSDGRVKLWDISSGDLVIELETDASNPSRPVEFSPDGSYLLYNDGGVLRRYPLDPDELIELAESRLTRDLTPDECRRYLSAGRCDEAA